MIITENTNLNGNIEVTDADGKKTTVMSINTNLNKTGSNFNMGFNIQNDESLSANLVTTQEQVDEFMVALKSKMVELGYKVTI